LELHFPYDREIIDLVKTVPGARWDPNEKCWHISLLAGPVEKLNHGYEPQGPEYSGDPDSAAERGIIPSDFIGIVQLTNFNALRF